MKDKILIGLGYKKGIGKDTCANLIKEYIENNIDYKVKKYSFADILKHSVAIKFALPELSLLDDQDFKIKHCLNFYKVNNKIYSKYPENAPKELIKNVTWRNILQLEGDYARNLYGEDFWINRLQDTITNSDADIILIPDVRYRNEAEWIKKNKGFLLKVHGDIISNDNHVSEIDLDSYNDWDYIIMNTSDLEHLKVTIDYLSDEILKNL